MEAKRAISWYFDELNLVGIPVVSYSKELLNIDMTNKCFKFKKTYFDQEKDKYYNPLLCYDQFYLLFN